MEDQLLNLALLGQPHDMIDAAKFYEKTTDMRDKAGNKGRKIYSVMVGIAPKGVWWLASGGFPSWEDDGMSASPKNSYILPAVMLYHKAGMMNKALDLAF